MSNDATALTPDEGASRPEAGATAAAGAGLWSVTLALAGMALLLRLLYWWSTGSNPLRSDAGQYHEIAANLANGEGFAHVFPQLQIHATAFRPPVYPSLLAVLYLVTGPSQGVARGFAVAIGVAFVVVLHRVLLRHVTPRAALVGTAMVAAYPPLVANDTVPLTETLSLLFLVLLVDRVVVRAWAWAGVLCGLLVLTRPSAQGLIVVIAMWLFVTVGWKRALGTCAIAVLVVTPWLVRNTMQVGATTIVTSNGFNLAALYSPQAEAWGAFIDPVVDRGFDEIRLLQFDEAAWDRELTRRAVENIKRNPGQVLHVVSRNAEAHFEISPSLNRNAEAIDGRNMTVRSWTLPFFYMVTLAGFAGVWVGRQNRFVLLLFACGAYFAITSLFLVAPPRLRAPLDLACCVGVGVLVDWGLARWRLRKALAPAPHGGGDSPAWSTPSP